MTIAFTICSNNFLAQAKTMFQSLGRHHPEIKTFIFLVDAPNETIDYTFFSPAEIIVVEEKIVAGFMNMVERYNLVELNTAVRPFIIQYLHGYYPETDRLYYLDPDMYIYGRLDELDKLLEKEDIIITPHFLRPIPIDGHTPFENLALNYGTYNLGFFALNPTTANTKYFLSWWGERTKQFSHIDVSNGYFTDQIWFNLVPIFFKEVHSLAHPGYNMAAWNLYERSIKSYGDDGKIMLSSGDPLIIYHFSSWDFNSPEKLSGVYNRFNFENRPDLKKLYADYHQALIKNRIEFFYKIPCTIPYNKKIVRRSRMQKILLPGIDLMRKVWQKI